MNHPVFLPSCWLILLPHAARVYHLLSEDDPLRVETCWGDVVLIQWRFKIIWLHSSVLIMICSFPCSQQLVTVRDPETQNFSQNPKILVIEDLFQYYPPVYTLAPEAVWSFHDFLPKSCTCRLSRFASSLIMPLDFSIMINGMVQIMKLLNSHFSPVFCHSSSFRFACSPRYSFSNTLKPVVVTLQVEQS